MKTRASPESSFVPSSQSKQQQQPIARISVRTGPQCKPSLATHRNNTLLLHHTSSSPHHNSNNTTTGGCDDALNNHQYQSLLSSDSIQSEVNIHQFNPADATSVIQQDFTNNSSGSLLSANDCYSFDAADAEVITEVTEHSSRRVATDTTLPFDSGNMMATDGGGGGLAGGGGAVVGQPEVLGPESQFSLRWNNHTSTFCHVLSALRDKVSKCRYIGKANLINYFIRLDIEVKINVLL